MNHAITIELQFFLISILWGGILLLAYDVLRILRRLIKHGSILIAFEDLIFWILASIFIFAMMYRENNGIIRGFSILGMAIGMVLYHNILSDLVVAWITKLIHTLLRPFMFAYKRVKKFVLFLAAKGRRLIKFLWKQLKKYRKSVTIVLNKRKQAALVKKQKRLAEKEIEDKKKQEKKLAKQKAAQEKSSEQRIAKQKKIDENKKRAKRKRKNSNRKKSVNKRSSDKSNDQRNYHDSEYNKRDNLNNEMNRMESPNNIIDLKIERKPHQDLYSSNFSKIDRRDKSGRV